MTRRPQRDDETMARALVTLSRYSADITDIAVTSLGRNDIENRDIELLLAIHDTGPVTPTRLAVENGTSPSVVSRALGRLEEAGLVTRTRDGGDRRSVLVTVTRSGRRRVSTFADRLTDYFRSGEPLLKDLFHELGLPLNDARDNGPVGALDAAAGMGSAGAAYVEDVAHALAPFAVREFAERLTLLLVFVHRVQRPTQLAAELGFTLGGTSKLLTRLETAKLVTRRHDTTPGDRRAVTVELTPRGERAVLVQVETFRSHAARLAVALRGTWRV